MANANIRESIKELIREVILEEFGGRNGEDQTGRVRRRRGRRVETGSIEERGSVRNPTTDRRLKRNRG